MIGLIGFNWFNNTNSVGRDLWALALSEGGGNPGFVPKALKKPGSLLIRCIYHLLEISDPFPG